MSKREYDILLNERLEIRRSLYEQEERLKKIEERLKALSSHDEIAEVSAKRSWWFLFEQYHGHYALRFLGMILFFTGAFLSVTHAIAIKAISVSTGIYGSLAIAALCGIGGFFLRRKSPLWSSLLFEGAFILAYGALLVGYKDYSLFSPLTLQLGVLGISAASLLVASSLRSRLFALLALVFIGYIAIAHPYAVILRNVVNQQLLLIAGGALILSLVERWYSIALLSYGIVWLKMVIKFAYGSAYLTIPEIFIAMGIFLCIPCVYALYKRTDGLLESVIVGVGWTGFLIVPCFGRIEEFSAFLAPVLPFIVQLSQSLQYSIIALLGGFLPLLALGIVSWVSSNMRVLKVTLYILMMSALSSALLSLTLGFGSCGSLFIHGLAWLCCAFWFWGGNSFYINLFIVIEFLIVLIQIIVGLFVQPISGEWLPALIGAISYGTMSSVSYVLGKKLFAEEDTFLNSWKYRDIFFAFSSASFFYAWAVVSSYKGISPVFIGLPIALYGAIIVLMARGANRILTGSVGYGALFIGHICALIRFIASWEGGIHSWGITSISHTSRFSVLKEATLLLGGLIILDIFLFIAMQARKQSDSNPLYARMQPFVGGMAGFLLFLLIRLYLIAGAQYYTLLSQMKGSLGSFMHFIQFGTTLPVSFGTPFERNLLSAYYALTGLLLVAVGSVYRHSTTRLLGIILLLANAATLLYSLGIRSLGLADELIIMGIGGMVVLASFFYKRVSRR